MTRKILVPHDFTSYNQKALDFVVENFGNSPDVHETLFHAYAQLPEIDLTANPEMLKLRSPMISLKRELKEKEAELKTLTRYFVKGGFGEEHLKRECVMVHDVRNDNRIQYPAQAKEEGIASMISIPIVVSENVMRALRLYHSEIWEVSDQDLDSLTLLAVFIGMAMVHVSIVGTINTIDELIHTGFSGNVLGRSSGNT